MSDGKKLLVRLLMAVPLYVLACFLFCCSPGGPFLGVPLAALCIGFGSVLLVPPLLDIMTEPVASLLWPGRRRDKPLPTYGPAEARAKMGLHKEAIAAYEKILEEYPQELKAYIGIIDVNITRLQKPALAEVVYRRGLAALKSQEDRDNLTRMYNAIRSKLDAPPEWAKPRKIQYRPHEPEGCGPAPSER
ncbi:MAG: hypothetical protein JXR37_00835 [Kiritimatiellae bacterium]|nr:hypothetical protein [Kiritimatiellia bacterium]